MDPNVAFVFGAAFGLLLGAGVAYAWRYSERAQTIVPPQPEPEVPVGAVAVLSVLRSSAVIVDAAERVVKASAPAHAMGLVQDTRLENPAMRELVRQVRRDGQVREDEIVLRLGHRRQRHVLVRVAPLTSRLVVVLVDDRTRERHVERIRRDFVANVSHELKTPVGALNLLAEAVAEAHDDPEAVVRFAGRMQREGERLTRLVQQIIELSRLQGDDLVDEPQEVDVARLVRASVEANGTDAELRGIDIAMRCDDELYVLGDPSQLLQALNNLVENAVAYSPERTHVSVVAEHHDEDVQVTVRDQGIGIPAPELERIFERFYRVDPARSRSTGGTGLGLSIVKHVAASHGGSVEVWSEPGEGSSFTLVLPAAARTREDAEGSDAEGSGETPPPAGGEADGPAAEAGRAAHHVRTVPGIAPVRPTQEVRP
ncbi:two-component system sensor histidine kinase SenX3 [Mumia flava]|uniref:Sensor-like histidine kinase SenX3 n=1 Tax=Mumia flava TaxID=1348852 RepID=A0A2M9BGP4_9ACTN|nr:ATP-binding protein [Mumia flava]PJJ57111.1 two-component system sensor histidine kinase SenX3 [Mumia flava]